MENTFVDWTDGEIENITLETTLSLQNRIKTLKSFVNYQTGLITEKLINSNSDFSDIWLNLDKLKESSIFNPTSSEIILENGKYYGSNGDISSNDSSWYKKAVNSSDIIITVKQSAFTLKNPDLILAKKITINNKLIGVNAVHFSFPEIFNTNNNKIISGSIKRNNYIEGFLLSMSKDGSVYVVASQKRDYNSPPLLWNMPFLSDVLENKAAIINKIKSEVITKRKIYMVRAKFKDERYLWAFAPIDENIILATLTPLNAIITQVNIASKVADHILSVNNNKFIWLLLFSLLLAAIIAIFIASSIVRRIIRLSKSLDKVEDGKPFKYEHENVGDEFSHLSHKIETVIRHQQSDIDECKKQ